jgi:hypothetical protein
VAGGRLVGDIISLKTGEGWLHHRDRPDQPDGRGLARSRMKFLPPHKRAIGQHGRPAFRPVSSGQRGKFRESEREPKL